MTDRGHTSDWSQKLWMIGCVVLCLTGCTVFRAQVTPSTTQPAKPPPQDVAFAQALAHYADGLLSQAESGPASRVQADFDAAHRLDPDSRRPVDAAVLQWLEQKHPAKALDALEAFCAAHPDDFAAHRDLARLAESGQDPERAARHYAAAARLHPDDLTLSFGLVRNLFAAQHDREALRVMRRLARANPTTETRGLPLFWGLHFVRHDHAPARALPCISLAAASATGLTQRVECRSFYGETALAAGRTNDAVDAFQQALAEDPVHIRAALALGLVLYARDGAPALTRHVQQTERTPQDVAAWLTLAGLRLAAQDRTNAVPALARIHDLLQAQQRTPSEMFYLLQGGTLDEIGRCDAAAAVFQEALQRYPRADNLMNYLAYMWAVANVHLKSAEDLAQQAVKQRPRNGAYLDTLGWVLFRQHRLGEALTLLLQALERMPDDPTVLDHVGDALASLNRTPEAMAYWSRSFAADASQTTVAEKLRTHGVDPARIPRIQPPADDGDEDDPAE